MKQQSGFTTDNEAAGEAYRVAALVAALLFAGVAANLLAVASASAGFSIWELFR